MSSQNRSQLQSIHRQLSKKIRERESGVVLSPQEMSDVNAMLSSGNIAPGTAIEFLSRGDGSGAMSMACRLAGRLQHLGRGTVVIVDAAGDFYPPGAIALGLALEQTVLVRPATQRDMLWAVEQALRCPDIGAVVCHLGAIDALIGRRLMLAAEVGNTVGLFARPASAQKQSSFASVRFDVQPVSTEADDSSMMRKLKVKTLYVRGGGFQESVVHVDVGRCPEAA